LVGAAQVEAERLGPLDHPGDVRIAAQQIVDDLSSQGFLPANHVPPCQLVPVDQRLDGVIDNPQHRVRGGPHLVAVTRPDDHRQFAPQPPRRRQVQVDRLSGADALFGGTSAELADGLEFSFLWSTPGYGGVGEDGEVFTE
jgi:hypothetical protein